MKPVECRNERDVCKLRRDNSPGDRGFISLSADGKRVPWVSINDGRGGEVNLPRREFVRLCNWYFTDQKERK